VIGAFGTGGLVLSAPTLGALAGAAIGASLGWGVYEAYKWADHTCHQVEVDNDNQKPAEENKEFRKKPQVRTEPKNLEEQLALEEARYNPGKEIPQKKLEIKDKDYPKEDWAKKQHIHEGLNSAEINVHYWENRHTGDRHGFKFKDTKN
jgi:hypothetical protein